MIDKDIIAPIIFLVIIIIIYTTKLDKKTYFINVYMYLLLAISLILLLSKYISFNIRNLSSIILILVLLIISLPLIYSENLIISHIGFLILIFLLSSNLIISRKNITKVLILSGLAFILLTIFTIFILNDDSKKFILSKDKYLAFMLFAFTFFIIVVRIINPNIIDKNIKVISVIGILIFVLLTMHDTIIKYSNSHALPGISHTQVNYPKESVSLILDFMNIFINMYNLMK